MMPHQMHQKAYELRTEVRRRLLAAAHSGAAQLREIELLLDTGHMAAHHYRMLDNETAELVDMLIDVNGALHMIERMMKRNQTAAPDDACPAGGVGAVSGGHGQ